MLESTARNASLQDMVTLLREQHGRKIDMVVPAGRLRSVEGDLQVSGVEPILSDDGVTDPNGVYRPTAVCDEGVADKMGIPLPYVRRLRAGRPDLLDANVNGWLHGRRPKQVPLAGGGFETVRPGIDGDSRQFLLRAFRGDGDDPGVARAFLSDRYAVMDHLDALTAALDGVKEAGVEIDIVGADLTERRMMVRVAAPSVKALAPTLLRGYRSPWTGATGDENPTVFAGFEISNSETGGGAYSIVPRLIVQICSNGMKVSKDAIRAVHLGSRLDEGVIRWSGETQQKNVELVRLKTRDAVKTFLDVEYMTRTIASIEEGAGRPVDKVDDVKVLTKRLAYSQAETDGILEHFVRGGQMTRGGVLNAITSFAQTVTDPDAAFDVEHKALQVLSI